MSKADHWPCDSAAAPVYSDVQNLPFFAYERCQMQTAGPMIAQPLR